MLTDLKLKQEYRTKENPPLNFYIDCLEQSIRYDRSAGYFTSSGISKAAQGFSNFIKNGGKIRLVVSPSFHEEQDIKAIVNGLKQKQDVIERAMLKTVESVKFGIEKERFKTLCWLVAKGHIEIKVAIKVDSKGNPKRGIYHEKMGVFYDEESNKVAFTGSSNETKGGWVDNFESIDVYRSWGVGDDPSRVQKKKENFERLWNDSTKELEIIDIPTAVKRKIIRKAPPNRPDKEIPIDFEKMDEMGNDQKIKYPDFLEEHGLRPYQSKMIELWEDHDRSGLFSMATGTGKTITALAASVGLFIETDRLLVIVCCPNNPLVDQWKDVAELFNFRPIIAAKSSKKWVPKVNNLRRMFNQKLIDIGMVITNNQTLFSERGTANLLELIDRFKECPILFIADEVHNLGAKNIRKNLPENFPYRIGLTATPKRYFDEVGTEAIYKYFGEPLPIDPPVDLKFAIDNNYLCPYNYYPFIVFLNDEETEKYHYLTKEINKLRSYLDEESKQLQLKYQERTSILNDAQNKIDVFDKVLKESNIRFNKTLYFCSPNQIEPISELLINKYNYQINQINYKYSEIYRQIIKDFSNGLVDGLTAISVIDEGLDVPSTVNGFFLASTGNEKQFIQRRGRVLRKAENKEYANIYDFIVIPNGNIDDKTNIVKKALERELKRFNEFAKLASNYLEAKDIILDIALDNNIVI